MIRDVEILLVEDNAADARLVKEVLKRDSKWNPLLHVVRDGVEALDFLKRKGKYATAARPNLIILDLNLPLRDGREVLNMVKENPDLGKVPIVILTSSDNPQDIDDCYRHHANSYVVKPAELDDFFDKVGGIETFWLDIAQLP